MTDAVIAVALADSAREAKQARIVVWVMSLALVGLLFDMWFCGSGTRPSDSPPRSVLRNHGSHRWHPSRTPGSY